MHEDDKTPLHVNLIKRRVYLKSIAAMGTVSIVPRHVLGGKNHTAPSDKLNIAGIGVGGRGGRIIQSAATEHNIVALCDVDYAYAAPLLDKFPKAALYKDYRVMLDKQTDIDAVMIGTPDHTHAVISVAAMQAGKHVYCEKPMTHDVYEARRVAQVAKESGVITQLGIQRHATEGPRLINEWINAGAIGEVREVDAWSTLSFYPFGHKRWSPALPRRPKEILPVPSGLAWDQWIGPASMRPYHRVYHPGSWRAWWDFGTGMMGDRGVHTIDPIMWALKLGAPESIEATSTGLNPDTHPLTSIVTFRFPASAGQPPVKLTWYEGLRPPRPVELEDGRLFGGEQGGILFKGDQGLLMSDYTASSPRLIPEQSMREFMPNRPPKTIPRIEDGDHILNWIRACKGLEEAGTDFGYGARLTEICLLGNVAKRVNGVIRWDGDNMRVTNNDEANQYIQTEYRQGWSL
jgi:predicted dehydrogenase